MSRSALCYFIHAIASVTAIARILTPVIVAYAIAAGFGVPAAFSAPGDSFSFAVIADPHICYETPGDPNARLRECVDWINRNRLDRDIEFVFVLGDIGYVEGGQAVRNAKAILDGLAVPYVPIQGDNDCVTPADEIAFADTFGPVYESLAANPKVSNWQKAPAPVYDPQVGTEVYLQNFTFDFEGVHFICADWCDRTAGLRREDADLHDFPGGTWPWFTDTISTCSKDKLENIVMFSHHPMHTMGGELWFLTAYAGFDNTEFGRISGFLSDPNHDFSPYIAEAYGGHYHFDAFLPADMDPNRINVSGFPVDPNIHDTSIFLPLPGYDLYAVSATYAEPSRVSVVRVTEGEDRFSYQTTSYVVPEPSVILLVLLGEVLRRRRHRSVPRA